MAWAEIPERELVERPEVTANYLAIRYGSSDQEIMGAIFLDARNRVISEREIFRGTMVRTAVEPRPVIREAILISAASIILFHTHPSGNPEPSAEDMGFTRRLSKAADIMNIKLVDHLILGARGRWVSLRRCRLRRMGGILVIQTMRM